MAHASVWTVPGQLVKTLRRHGSSSAIGGADRLAHGGLAPALALCLGLFGFGCASANATSSGHDGGSLSADAGGVDTQADAQVDAQAPEDGSVGAGDVATGDSASGVDGGTGLYAAPN